MGLALLRLTDMEVLLQHLCRSKDAVLWMDTIRMPVDVHLQMQAVQCAQTPRSRSTRLCRSCRRCDDCNGGGTVLVPAADASTNVVKAMQSPTRRGSLALGRNQRKTLQFHWIFTGTFTFRLLMVVVLSPVFARSIAKVLDFMVTAGLSTKRIL